jgi:hypothetical protein
MTDLAKIQLGFTVVTDCHASISLEKAGMLYKWSAFTLQTLGKIFQSLFRQTYPLALNSSF